MVFSRKTVSFYLYILLLADKFSFLGKLFILPESSFIILRKSAIAANASGFFNK